MEKFIDISSQVNSMRHIDDMFRKQREDQFHRDNPVVHVCESIGKYVRAFEAALDAEHEVGVRLVSFGNAVFFHAEQIGFSKPHLITFSGVTPEGEQVQLIQHVSQLSFLLKAASKLGEKAKRIGFVWE